MHASFVKVRVHVSESWELKDKTIMDEILINCSILGHDVDSIFGVRILDSTPVGELKKAIKKEKEPELDRIAADKLHIWKVGDSAQHTHHHSTDV